jgi:hypothetical protein
MPSIPEKDRISLCRFSFSDHRRCRTPRSPHHPHFCYFHAREESQTHANSELAGDIAYFFSAEYLSANDLNAALARLFPAIIRGDIKPRMAKTLVYLAQIFSQTIPIAQKEYIEAYGGNYWRSTIRTTIKQNSKRDEPSSQPDEEATASAPPISPAQSTVTTPPNNSHPKPSEGSPLPHSTAPPTSSPQSTPSTTRPPSASTPLNATLPKNTGRPPSPVAHRTL